MDIALTRELTDGGTLLYVPEFIPAPESDLLLQTLKSDVPWRQESTTRGIRLPRLTAYYADPGAVYQYSGVIHAPEEWLPNLTATREFVEECVESRFNSVLLNYYRNGNDSMGYHADDEPELGENPNVSSISLGSERRFVLKHQSSGERIELMLEHGSLLVMGGTLQHHWKHALPKMRTAKGERINLTLRQIGEPTA